MQGARKRFPTHGMSRRQLLEALSVLGLTSGSEQSFAEGPLPPVAGPEPHAPSLSRVVTGSGGLLLVQQLKSAGVEHIFFNPGTRDAAIYDALAETPEIHPIKGLQEGAVIAMADGYARASGKLAVAIVADIGLPNAMTQLVNAYKDRIPLLLAMAAENQDVVAAGTVEEYDHQEMMLAPITKWTWKAGLAEGIPQTVRLAHKYASTPPSGPVFLAVPDTTLRMQASAAVTDHSTFDVPMRVRPDRADIESIARSLLQARNPLLTVGDEITLAGGQPEVLELAQMLGLPVMGRAGYGQWSTPFPTRSPLFIGPIQGSVAALGQIDVHLNIGSRDGEQAAPGARLISIRNDPRSLGQGSTLHLGVVADAKLAAADLVEAIRGLSSPAQLKQIAEGRTQRVSAFTQKAAQARASLARDLAGNSSITLERLALELEGFLEKDTLYVADVDSGRNMDPLMSFGGQDKTYFGNGPSAMGWGMAAALGVKLARPDSPVVAVVGDGSFLFSGPQPLWSISRYQAPITIIVLNNRSYNNERNRIWAFEGGAQLRLGLDMTCYNGSPDVDIVKASIAFGVEAEAVTEPHRIRSALERAKRANIEGRPYLLEMMVERNGIGAASQWHPQFSIASLRTRRV